MLFNPDPIKQVIKVCFSHKRDKEVYPPLKFNNNNVQSANSQKHVGLVLGSKLYFNKHVKNKIIECNKSVARMKKLSLTLSRNSLLTIYKTFVRPFGRQIKTTLEISLQEQILELSCFPYCIKE